MKNIGWLALLGIGLYVFSKKDAATQQNGEQTTTPLTGEQLLDAWIERIKQTPEWYNLIVQKAADSGLTIPEQLIHDATWVIQQGWPL